MKICNIYIKNYDQFSNVNLDFTDPKTGEPVNKICFIGRNGTGKSKILKVISWLETIIFAHLTNRNHPNYPRNRIHWPTSFQGKIIYKLTFQEVPYFIICFKSQIGILKIGNLGNDEETQLLEKMLRLDKIEDLIKDLNSISIDWTKEKSFVDKLAFQNNSHDLLIYSPAESNSNGYLGIFDVPKTNVSEALKLFTDIPYYSQVSSETVNAFWKLLIYNLKKRDEERENFERHSENLNKTKAQLIKEFDDHNPEILTGLANIWNKILAKASLEFDVKRAKNPIQLDDNLKAYIKLISSDEVISYNALSTGIRNFIFRIGHIYSLYFNREIDRAILLVDEPENSLFPDFLFELVETYNEIVVDKRGQNNTQMFFATHNPIIAAQFKPCERVILDWDDNASIKTFKGFAPEGDDPNDILKKDFGLSELMGPKGLAEWIHYLNLRKQLKKVATTDEKMSIASEINRIGQLYNFPT